MGADLLTPGQHNAFFPHHSALSEQPVVDTATATEQAKQLVKSGAISAIKAETKNSGFKRSRTLEGKLKVSTAESLFREPLTSEGVPPSWNGGRFGGK